MAVDGMPNVNRLSISLVYFSNVDVITMTCQYQPIALIISHEN